MYVSADHFVDSGQLGVMGFSPDYWARTTRLVGLLLERSFGIAAWQPAWLLLGPAVAAALHVGSRRVPLLVAVLAVGWLNAAYVALTLAGWWVPGRQIVVVLPAAVPTVRVVRGTAASRRGAPSRSSASWASCRRCCRR